MKLKSYFSGTVEAAMDLARKELGEEALLVNARPATPETRYLGEYEVVFGLPRFAGLHEAREAKGAAPPSAERPMGGNQLAQQVAELKREFDRMTHSLRNSSVQAKAEIPSHFNEKGLQDRSNSPYSRLLAQDLDSALAQSVATGAPLEALIRTDSELGVPGCPRRVVVLVGPPGAGKTTTLVKLAARYGLQGPRPAQILSADVHRIAAADQLRALARILGLSCEVAETAEALTQMLEAHRDKDLILVDMPGLAPREMEDAAALAACVRSHPHLDIHLVLPAYLRSSDMSAAIELYSCFAPKKLLFTRIDETAQFGPLVNVSARWALPISYLANGQQIPDDIEPASAGRITELVQGTGHAVHSIPSREYAPLAKGAGA